MNTEENSNTAAETAPEQDGQVPESTGTSVPEGTTESGTVPERTSSFTSTAPRNTKPQRPEDMTTEQLRAMLAGREAVEEITKDRDLKATAVLFAAAAMSGDNAGNALAKANAKLRADIAAVVGAENLKDGDSRAEAVSSFWTAQARAFELAGVRPNAEARANLGDDYEEPGAFLLARQTTSYLKRAALYLSPQDVAELPMNKLRKATREAEQLAKAGNVDRLDAVWEGLKAALFGVRVDGKLLVEGAIAKCHPIRVDSKGTKRRVRGHWHGEYKARLIAGLETALEEAQAIQGSPDVMVKPKEESKSKKPANPPGGLYKADPVPEPIAAQG